MKKFILFCFFVSCILTQLYAKSQGTVEKMNYSPIKSGNYYNLISKGDTNINRLYQNNKHINFMIYSTFLEIYPININNSKIEIEEVSSYDGVVMGRTENISFANGTFLGDISCLNCDVTIGNVISNGNLNFYTDIAEINNANLGTLTLDGMDFPKCPTGWYWKNVQSANNNSYNVLACDSGGSGSLTWQCDSSGSHSNCSGCSGTLFNDVHQEPCSSYGSTTTACDYIPPGDCELVTCTCL